MTDQPLNQWQHEAYKITEKTAKLYARHQHLLASVPQQRTISDVLLVLTGADLCVKGILAQMDKMEALCGGAAATTSE